MKLELCEEEGDDLGYEEKGLPSFLGMFLRLLRSFSICFGDDFSYFVHGSSEFSTFLKGVLFVLWSPDFSKYTALL